MMPANKTVCQNTLKRKQQQVTCCSNQVATQEVSSETHRCEAPKRKRVRVVSVRGGSRAKVNQSISNTIESGNCINTTIIGATCNNSKGLQPASWSSGPQAAESTPMLDDNSVWVLGLMSNIENLLSKFSSCPEASQPGTSVASVMSACGGQRFIATGSGSGSSTPCSFSCASSPQSSSSSCSSAFSCSSQPIQSTLVKLAPSSTLSSMASPSLSTIPSSNSASSTLTVANSMSLTTCAAVSPVMGAMTRPSGSGQTVNPQASKTSPSAAACKSTSAQGGGTRSATQSSSNSLPRSPISRQIKFHEYKGPPMAKRHQSFSSTTAPSNTPNQQKQLAGSSSNRMATKPPPVEAPTQHPVEQQSMAMQFSGQRSGSSPANKLIVQTTANITGSACPTGDGLSEPAHMSLENLNLGLGARLVQQQAVPQLPTLIHQHHSREAQATPSELAEPPSQVNGRALDNQGGLEKSIVYQGDCIQQYTLMPMADNCASNHSNNCNSDESHNISHMESQNLTTSDPCTVSNMDACQSQQQQETLSGGNCQLFQTNEAPRMERAAMTIKGPPMMNLDGELTDECSEIEPSIGGFSHGIEELLFSEFIDLQNMPMNVDESEWLKKFLPPCTIG